MSSIPLAEIELPTPDDGFAPAAPSIDARRARQRHGLGAVLAYATCTVIAYWPIGIFSSARLTYAGIDVSSQVWDFAWMPHVLGSGLNPFFTSSGNAPFGVNLVANNGMPLLTFLGMPIELLVGPIGTYNFFVRLAYLASASAMFFVLRRFVRSDAAAFLGGLAYGFSPYMIGQGYDHLMLLFVPLPPIFVATLDAIIVRRTLSPRRGGIVLGLLCTAQFLISAEVFGDTVLLCAIGVVLLSLRFRRAAIERARDVVVAFGIAGLTFAILAGYPLWFLIDGPQHLAGSPQAFEIGTFRSDLAGTVIPGHNQRLGLASWIAHGSGLGGGDFVEDGTYIGIPLIIISAVIVAKLRRDTTVVLVAALAAIAFVFSLGSPLTINGSATALPLPFALFHHIPLLDDEAAARYSFVFWLFESAFLALGLDRLASHVARRSRSAAAHARRRRLTAPAVVGAVGLVALLPVLPSLPYTTMPTAVPAYFTNGDASALPAGSVALTYPYPMWPFTQAAIWNTMSGLRVDLLGSDASTPQNAPGAGEGTPPVLQPPAMQTIIAVASYGEVASAVYGSSIGLGQLPPDNAATAAQLRTFLSNYDVQTILVDPAIGADPATFVQYVTHALGTGPVTEDGMEVYYNVQLALLNHTS